MKIRDVPIQIEFEQTKEYDFVRPIPPIAWVILGLASAGLLTVIVLQVLHFGKYNFGWAIGFL